MDITDAPALKAWIESAGKELGGIDILVSNAGAMAQGSDPASWEANFRLDILGAVNAFEAARPFLEKAAEEKGDAAFVLISSISAAESEWASSYGPIKAALIHHAKGLARQVIYGGLAVVEMSVRDPFQMLIDKMLNNTQILADRGRTDLFVIANHH